jgi:hypothetical protein
LIAFLTFFTLEEFVISIGNPITVVKVPIIIIPAPTCHIASVPPLQAAAPNNAPATNETGPAIDKMAPVFLVFEPFRGKRLNFPEKHVPGFAWNILSVHGMQIQKGS